MDRETNRPTSVNISLEQLVPEELQQRTIAQIIRTISRGISLTKSQRAKLFESTRIWAWREGVDTFRSPIWLGEPGVRFKSTRDLWDRLNHTQDPARYKKSDREIRNYNGLPRVEGVLRENRSKVLVISGNLVAGTDFNERLLVNLEQVQITERGGMFGCDVGGGDYRRLEVEEMKELYRIFIDANDKLQEIGENR